MPYVYGHFSNYAAGDYYAGDLFGRLKRGITGAVGGFLKGGPVGAVLGGATGVMTERPAAPVKMPMPQLPPPISSGGIVPFIGKPAPMPFIATGGRQGPNVPATFPGAVPEPGILGATQRFLPGGQSGFTGAPPGYHVNKAYLRHLKAAAAGKATQNPFNAQRAVNVIVKNRKVNPLNPNALKRSVSRQRGMVRMMRGVLAGTGFKVSRSGVGGKRRVGRKR